MASKRTSAKRNKATPKRRRAKAASAAAAQILAWEDDPESGLAPIQRPAANLSGAPFPTRIENMAAPAPKIYKKGTAEFRYWNAADALRRGCDFWGAIIGVVPWQPGGVLPVDLDHGEDLNAFYDRVGLRFFHGAAGAQTVFSGESPDIVCHELGHALLDAIRPELWDAGSAEIAAFHESFGDMSAILSTLQIQSVRFAILQETQSHLFRSSRLSRLAEQLGRAIRLIRADLADPDCLRNAVNSFFYREPESLPPNAPASQLSSEPHSFSRVFTAGFFGTLSNMLALSGGQPTEQQLQAVSVDAAKLLVAAILAAPVVPNYYSQVAAHMLEADQLTFGGKYRESITAGFTHCGILSLQSLRAVAKARPVGAAARRPMVQASSLPHLGLVGDDFGITGEKILVRVASDGPRLPALSAAMTGNSLPAADAERAARCFLEDLLQRGHVSVASKASYAMRENPRSRKSHELVRTQAGLALTRCLFDCGWPP